MTTLGAKPASALRAGVIALAEEAGRAIMSVYAKDFSVDFKDDRSPLTEADMASHHLLVDGLQRLTPDIPVLSEESAEVPWATRREWTRLWLVDPLDGTREFVKKNGEFCICIALIDEGEPMLGVIHSPVTGTTWSAERGQAAYRRDASGHERRLFVRSPAARPLRVAASRSHLDARTVAFLEQLPDAERLALGSALKFGKLAEGAMDVYPRFGPTSEWDTAAGQCVVEVAGGAVLTMDGEPLRYNQRPTLLNGDFIALGDPALPWRNWID